LDAVQRVHRLVSTGYRDTVDRDFLNYCLDVPHAALGRLVALGVYAGCLLRWLKRSLETVVVAEDGRGG